MDFSLVKVHAGKRAEESARLLNAEAYAVGQHIVLGPGTSSTAALSGNQALAHELVHLSQQRLMGAPLLQRRSRASETTDLLEWWDSSSEAVRALRLLEFMDATDYNDTLRDMIASGHVIRLVRRLDRPDIIRFLRLLGSRGTRANQEGVINAIPLFNLSGENQLLVFMAQFQAGMGARGAPPPAHLRSLVSADPSGPFGGVGATGRSPAQAPMGLGEMWGLRSQAREATSRFGPRGLEYAQYHRVPGLEMLYDWSNPIKGALTGPGSYLAGLSPSERVGQAQLLLGQEISTQFRAAYGAILPTRVQVIRTAAAAHRLEPQLVAAIILAEQRDQSLREDAADYRGATMGGRSTSIGLGQVTVTTARRENLFRDLISPSMQRMLASGTDFANSMIAGLLASDDFNIFAVARYLRIVADHGSALNIAALPNTQAWVGPIDLSKYADHSSAWTWEHIRLIGSEYTSRPFDDVLVTDWGDFVLEAYNDVCASGMF